MSAINEIVEHARYIEAIYRDRDHTDGFSELAGYRHYAEKIQRALRYI